MNRNAGLVAITIALCTSYVHAASSYYRCIDPPNKCIARTEAEKADCPECKAWIRVFLDFQGVMQSARTEQKEAGIGSGKVATNFFLDAASEKVFGLDLTEEGNVPPKTRDVYKNPEKYGLRTLGEGESRVGSLAIVGDVAGVVTERAGKLLIAYPSAKTGKVRLIAPTALAEAEKTIVKYVVPAERRE
jgi:hypothetical protein